MSLAGIEKLGAQLGAGSAEREREFVRSGVFECLSPIGRTPPGSFARAVAK